MLTMPPKRETGHGPLGFDMVMPKTSKIGLEIR